VLLALAWAARPTAPMLMIINTSICSRALFTRGLFTSSFDADWASGAASAGNRTATLNTGEIRLYQGTASRGCGKLRVSRDLKGLGFKPSR
jgi:hypothetical protein